MFILYEHSISRKINIEAFYVGSKVLNANNRTSVLLFSESEFEEIFGRTFNASKDFVVPMNGDSSASGAHIDGCAHGTDSRGTGIFATFDRQVPAEIRVNYIVVLGK